MKETGLDFLKRFIFIDEVYQMVERAIIDGDWGPQVVTVPRHFHTDLEDVPEMMGCRENQVDNVYVLIRGEKDYEVQHFGMFRKPKRVPTDVKRMLAVYITTTGKVTVKLYQTGNNDLQGYALDRKINKPKVGDMFLSGGRHNGYTNDVRVRDSWKRKPHAK